MARNFLRRQPTPIPDSDRDAHDPRGYTNDNARVDRTLDTLQRHRVNTDWPMADTEPFTRTFDHAYDVDAFGMVAPGSDVTPVNPRAGWTRGELVRSAQPAFRLTHPVPMYDPTDPSQWNPGNW